MPDDRLTMIDYGGSNLRSVYKAFEAVGIVPKVTEEAEEVLQANRLVLPGVGAFGAGMEGLQRRGLCSAIRQAIGAGTPFLGICLGMQLLFEESEEMGRHRGLGVIKGRVVRFKEGDLKVPHMGWNQIEFGRPHVLLSGVPHGSHVFFVHSYYCQPTQPHEVIAETRYGRPFASIVGRENIFGIQFHPEKSQKVGLQILHNFATADHG